MNADANFFHRLAIANRLSPIGYPESARAYPFVSTPAAIRRLFKQRTSVRDSRKFLTTRRDQQSVPLIPRQFDVRR